MLKRTGTRLFTRPCRKPCRYYRAQGFNALEIGSEGIVHLDQFTLEGRENKSLRSAINRLSRVNHHAEFYPPPQSDLLMEELQAVSDEWLTHVHGSEKHFSLGWFEDSYIRNSPGDGGG